MSAKERFVRIDRTHDLPARARPLAADAVAKIFGGCKGEWVVCSNNYECCSNKCLYKIWIPRENRYEWECLPTWA